MTINLQTIATEHRNENTMNLDQMSSLEIITEMNREDALIASAIQPHLPNISKIIEYCIEAINQGGRIIYMGAGTSGRLGVLDAAECPPTGGGACRDNAIKHGQRLHSKGRFAKQMLQS